MTRGHDPTLWSTTEQVAAIRARELGSVELLDLQLARIEAVNPNVNAVCTLSLERARTEARRADDLAAHGEWTGPLHGIPVTIKDALATEGIRSTGGSVSLGDHVPLADAPAVASLRRGGAIVFGKTNLPEWSGDWQSFNELFGTTNNPWDLSRIPGGSSGGAAAAVATGMTSFELGTDIGGSVRVPSAFCGVFGHKPSFGIIPTLGYLDEPDGGDVESDVNVFGPIARDAADLRLLLDVLAGPTADRAPAWRLELPEPSSADGLGGLRVGVWFDEPTLPQDPGMLGVLHDVIPILGSAGARIDTETRPDLDITTAWLDGMRIIGAATGVSDGNRTWTHTDWMFADRARARLRLAWARYFEHVDVLLCPVAITTAIPHTQEGDFGTRRIALGGADLPYVLLGAWAALIGSVYLPSTAMPVGRTPAGLPVGMQVVAPFLHDRRAIAVAGLIAERIGGFETPPIVGGAP
jgi:amidase